MCVTAVREGGSEAAGMSGNLGVSLGEEVSQAVEKNPNTKPSLTGSIPCPTQEQIPEGN